MRLRGIGRVDLTVIGSNDEELLTVADILARHAVLIQQHGSAPGARGPGALGSALLHLQTGYHEDMAAE